MLVHLGGERKRESATPGHGVCGPTREQAVLGSHLAPPLGKVETHSAANDRTSLRRPDRLAASCPRWQETQGRPPGPRWLSLMPLGTEACLPISLPSLASSPLLSFLVPRGFKITAESRALRPRFL